MTPPRDQIPEGPRTLGELVTHLNDEEWRDFWGSLGIVIRLAARAVEQYDMSRKLT